MLLCLLLRRIDLQNAKSQSTRCTLFAAMPSLESLYFCSTLEHDSRLGFRFRVLVKVRVRVRLELRLALGLWL